MNDDLNAGAVIVAAGMSSRMGDFKPMLNIGSISIAQRIIVNFKKAGVDKIVMVTGYNATALERHLAGNGVVFLRNENYETTHMFDSAKIGLEYMRDRADKILFTPVDIPLFTSSTVTSLLQSGAALACPVCENQTGHPIMISSELVDIILNNDGRYGLKGALDSCGIPMEEIPVDDPGILRDADTPEDYMTLLEYHNAQLIRPEISVSLARELPFFDEKMAMLLSQVDETGSVRMACQRMQISYSTGWNIIRTLESQLPRPLLNRNQGGASGSRSELTEFGREFLEKYNAYSKEIKEKAVEIFDGYFSEEFT